jgi:hypothetical protein
MNWPVHVRVWEIQEMHTEFYFINFLEKVLYSGMLYTCIHVGFLLWLVLRSWRWRRHVPQKRRLTSNRPHDTINQNTSLFITITVNQSLTCLFSLYNLRFSQRLTITSTYFWDGGHAVGYLVEALCYKPGSIPDEVTGFFNWPNPSSRNMALESTQPLTEMSTRNLLADKWRPARKADNLTAICEPTV